MKLLNPIYVNRPYLPPLEEYLPYLEKIWGNKILTNNGPFHQQLENELCEYLGVKYISLFANGTLALIIALQEMRITGEVITAPFSFVATTHSLWWNNIKPVFVDIEPDNLNIDYKKIESAITNKTTAIMPVHVYGNPCNVQKIQEIADIYGLQVLYDAAHAFGVKINGESILNFGDMAVLSFHATKVFNTIEGGAIISHDKRTKDRIDYLKNFGFVGETTVIAPGINAKMNELQASYGLLQLKYVDGCIEKRKIIAQQYFNSLKKICGIHIFNEIHSVKHNYSYYPILVDSQVYGQTRDALYENLKSNGIYSRRYFYPLISNMPTYSNLPSALKENLPIANRIAEQILCLPIYPELSMENVNKICELISNGADNLF